MIKKKIKLLLIFGIILSVTTISITLYFVLTPQPQIKKVGQTLSDGEAMSVKVKDGVAYVTDISNTNPGLRFVDISNPKKPIEIGSYYNKGSPVRFDFLNSTQNIVCIANYGDGLEIVDVTDFNNPFRIAHYRPGTQIVDIIIQDRIAFIGAGNNGFEILNLSIPESPSLIASIPFSGRGCFHIEVHNDLCLTTHSDGNIGMKIFNISDLANPILVCDYMDSSLDIWEPKIQDSFLYFGDAGDTGGIYIYNISNLSEPTEIGRYNNGGRIHDIYLSDGFVFLANYNKGLEIVDIHDNTKPQLILKHYDGGRSLGVFQENNLVYLADGSDGLEILQVKALL